MTNYNQVYINGKPMEEPEMMQYRYFAETTEEILDKYFKDLDITEHYPAIGGYMFYTTPKRAQQLKDLGFPLIDAPVSGGVVKAVSGGLAIMAGGDADTISALRPLLDPLGKVFLTGGSGSGHCLGGLGCLHSRSR
jgi:6-phosphogluconate dehydrogenase (decarboxylating)